MTSKYIKLLLIIVVYRNLVFLREGCGNENLYFCLTGTTVLQVLM